MNRRLTITAAIPKPQFCETCEVSMDLHDGEDSCDLAESKAQLLESFGRSFRR